jgi:hypothetical protein
MVKWTDKELHTVTHAVMRNMMNVQRTRTNVLGGDVERIAGKI